MIILKEIDFDHRIELRETWNGKWVHRIHLGEAKSWPSQKFPTSDLALADAKQILQFMT
ncbi:hypothetical protein [Rhizobium sp. Leaf391]|uniref:hypothetical protein n=1 Tax=Rhizobium sp. Leaf391 TaxID=1736360 RepID=UPI000A47AB66|nr:hypothetical protein [Rhizobium sp. Leaf391]